MSVEDASNVPLLVSLLLVVFLLASSVLDLARSLIADFSAVLRIVDTAVLCLISGRPITGILQQEWSGFDKKCVWCAYFGSVSAKYSVFMFACS